jgi:hypothetical protein
MVELIQVRHFSFSASFFFDEIEMEGGGAAEQTMARATPLEE